MVGAGDGLLLLCGCSSDAWGLAEACSSRERAGHRGLFAGWSEPKGPQAVVSECGLGLYRWWSGHRRWSVYTRGAHGSEGVASNTAMEEHTQQQPVLRPRRGAPHMVYVPMYVPTYVPT